MLDRLQKAGLIARRPNPDDRRGTLITSVASAADRMASSFESARIAQDKLLSSCSATELKIVSGAFERFAGLWNQEREKLRADDQPSATAHWPRATARHSKAACDQELARRIGTKF
jgi:hypothetical protein